MSRKNDHRVLIAGAGPAGLSAALFLRERGLDVEVVDPGEMPAEDELAVVLHRDTVQRLADAGVDLDLDREARTIDKIAIFDGARWCADVELAGSSPFRGAPVVVPRWLLCKKLDAVLRNRGGKVGWNHRLARVEVALDRVYADVDALELDGAGYAFAVTEKIVSRTHAREPAYLIAADGRDSLVRTQLRVPVRAVSEAETTVAFEVDTERDPGHEARIVIADAATAIWPLPGRGLRITFHLPGDARVDVPLGADELVALLRVHVPGMAVPFARVRRAALERRTPAIAERPNVGRAWLLGDAARVMPAAASQPLNQGVRDAHRLASALAQVLRDHDEPAPLAAYANAVRAVAARAADLGAAYAPGEHAHRFIAAQRRRILPLVPARGPDLDDVARRLGLTTGSR
jgi:2-polyprenyl-6-methoxyphenol hydroxylase-like FAD-dependent oxidoreductase